MEKIVVDGRTVEFDIPKTEDVINDILEIQGIMRMQIEKSIKADELAEKRKISEARKLVGVCQSLEYALGDMLQELLIKCSPTFKDGIPEDMTPAALGSILTRFATQLVLIGDPVKNL